MPVLEDQHERPERRRERQQVEEQRLERQQDGVREREEKRERRQRNKEERERQVSLQRGLLVAEARGGAADGDRERRLERADPAHEPLRRVGERVLTADRVDPPEVAADATRQEHLLHVGKRAQPGDVGAERSRVGGAGGDIDRGETLRHRLAGDRVGDPARALATRECGRVDTGEADAEEREPEQDEERRAEGRDGRGPAHHEAREPVPAAALDGPLPARGRERVDA